MHFFLRATMLAAALWNGGGAALADEIVSESRSVDVRATRINLDGIVNLKLKQGPVASLTLYGEKRYLQKVSLSQQGELLQIGSDIRASHPGKIELRAELTLPAVRELVSAGVGNTEVSGFSGDQLRLALDGAGAMKVAANYRNISAKLGGVGNLSIAAGQCDNVDLNLRGAGKIDISGQSKTLHAQLGGVGGLDAQQLLADAVDLNITGIGDASVYARNSANLKLSGLGSAHVYGKPANRNARTRGMGSISWN